MEKEAIEKWIEEYIENTIHITVDKKISLLDPRNGMLPRDLLQLYFAVESYFGIKFEERNVIDERFDYLCNMVDAIQEKLKKILDNVNSIYNNDISAKFLITLGDEFQGLLEITAPILEIIKYIQREIYPIKLRFGVGIGNVSTLINHEAAIGADGPAFYAAREMIEFLREQEKKLKKQAADIQISVYEKKCFETEEINAMFSLLKIIEDSWTEKQRYTIWDMMIHQGSQEMCAERMDITQSTVARRLADGKYIIYQRTMEVIDEAIRRLGNKRWQSDICYYWLWGMCCFL